MHVPAGEHIVDTTHLPEGKETTALPAAKIEKMLRAHRTAPHRTHALPSKTKATEAMLAESKQQREHSSNHETPRSYIAA